MDDPQRLKRRLRSFNRGAGLARRSLTAALVLTAASASAQPPRPGRPRPHPTYVVITQDIHIDRPAPAVWKSVGGFCALRALVNISCVYTSGDGGMGTHRLVNGRIDEVMVARTSTSYTYAQPFSPDLYHGTVEILPDGKGSKAIYTIFYDNSELPNQTAKDQDRVVRAKRFLTVLQRMKAVSEAP